LYQKASEQAQSISVLELSWFNVREGQRSAKNVSGGGVVRRAAAQDYGLAQFYLSLMYEKARGCKDAATAEDGFKRLRLMAGRKAKTI